MLARQITFDSLAAPDVYTVIAITTEHCSLSQGIRKRPPEFLAARKEAVFINVIDFSGTIMFTKRSEQRAWLQQREAIESTHKIDFGPKVVIHGSDRQPIVGNRAERGYGHRFMHGWMSASV